MKKKPAFILLFTLAVYLGIVILHPLSHVINPGHDGEEGHDCPICLWLHYAAAIACFTVIIFRVISRVEALIYVLRDIPINRISIPANISRAPPLYYA